jgi:hypothetical protein
MRRGRCGRWACAARVRCIGLAARRSVCAPGRASSASSRNFLSASDICFGGAVPSECASDLRARRTAHAAVSQPPRQPPSRAHSTRGIQTHAGRAPVEQPRHAGQRGGRRRAARRAAGGAVARACAVCAHGGRAPVPAAMRGAAAATVRRLAAAVAGAARRAQGGQSGCQLSTPYATCPSCAHQRSSTEQPPASSAHLPSSQAAAQLCVRGSVAGARGRARTQRAAAPRRDRVTWCRPAAPCWSPAAARAASAGTCAWRSRPPAAACSPRRAAQRRCAGWRRTVASACRWT